MFLVTRRSTCFAGRNKVFKVHGKQAVPKKCHSATHPAVFNKILVIRISVARISALSLILRPPSHHQVFPSISKFYPPLASYGETRPDQPTTRPSANASARQKIWERDNYGWKRGYYLTNISLRRPREWMSKAWSRGLDRRSSGVFLHERPNQI